MGDPVEGKPRTPTGTPGRTFDQCVRVDHGQAYRFSLPGVRDVANGVVVRLKVPHEGRARVVVFLMVDGHDVVLLETLEKGEEVGLHVTRSFLRWCGRERRLRRVRMELTRMIDKRTDHGIAWRGGRGKVRERPADVVNVADLGVAQHPRAGAAKVGRAPNGGPRRGAGADCIALG